MGGFVVALAMLAAAAAAAPSPPGTLRIGVPLVPETLDPALADNAQAVAVMGGIYDTLYGLDPLAKVATLVPAAAAALPEVSPDARTVTVRVRPGIRFVPHPSFQGKLRELTAMDFAYAIRRTLDPRLHSPSQTMLAGKIEGLDELAKHALESGVKFDYDTPIAGLQTPDRYTLRLTLRRPDPMFVYLLANPLLAGLAREAVEAEGAGYGHRPVGTGAFVVSSFTPGQRIALVRNPDYRTVRWEDLLSPPSRAAHANHPMRGRVLPGAARVEFSQTPEAASELMALRVGELDLIQASRPELAMRNGKLRDDLAQAGLVVVPSALPVTLLAFLNMRDPVVGGTSQEKVALRRAIYMAFDDLEWIRVLDVGLSRVRQQVVPPGVEGHIDGYRNPNMFDPAAANALLDRVGYRRGGDGFRRNIDGSPLTIGLLIDTKSRSRDQAEFAKRMLDRIGLRTSVEVTTAGELLKRLSNCHHTLAWMDWGLDIPDGTNPMMMFASSAIGAWNFSCFADAAFDEAYQKALVIPPGPERAAAFRTMQTRIDAYGAARPFPWGDLVLIKRRGVLGPFNTVTDWLQVVTLTLGSDQSAPAARLPARP
ncbi:MAG: ABC transporter substrate-binding protein [Burkholderiales bacterium]